MWSFKYLVIGALALTLVESRDSCVIKKFSQVSDVVKKCKNIIIDGISVPGGQQLKLNLAEGSKVTFRGNTSFEFFEWPGPLVYITGTNIEVVGEEGHVLDGHGQIWWDGLGTWGNITKPKFMRLKLKNSIVKGLKVHNCPVGCISILDSDNLIISNWTIDISEGDEGVAPPNKFGHNTDGFDVGNSFNILIENSVVYNQDDCVALNSGENITVRNLFCHGGHGLSMSIKETTIQHVVFEDSVVTKSENGIHLKTHVDFGKGWIRNITYKNILITDATKFGINVQQNYRNLPAGAPQDGPPSNNVPIYDLTLTNVTGNVEDGAAVPVYVLCAKEGCFDWKWEGVKIEGSIKDNCTNYEPEGYDC